MNSLTLPSMGLKKCKVLQILRLESTIVEAFTLKERLVAVFFDLQKSYDATWWLSILSMHHVRQVSIRESISWREAFIGCIL